MIVSKRGDILRADADAVTIPVNCVGVMGAGLAKQAAKKWGNDLVMHYRSACFSGELRFCAPGHPYFFYVGDLGERTKYVICFPTKRHYNDDSLVEDIDAGLASLRGYFHLERDVLPPPNIRSIAIPPLGCGLGHLDWQRQVRPLVVKHLGDIPDLDVQLYEP